MSRLERYGRTCRIGVNFFVSILRSTGKNLALQVRTELSGITVRL